MTQRALAAICDYLAAITGEECEKPAAQALLDVEYHLLRLRRDLQEEPPKAW